MSRRMLKFAAVLAAMAAPVGTATSAAGNPERITDAEFDASFARFEALPVAPQPGPRAVDLDTFDPPIEEEPAVRPLADGIASYYGRRFHGRLTANGERFDMNAMTAAHRTLPFGTMVRVTNPVTGAWVDVRINDRGPFTGGRTIDLSRAAAEEIGLIRRGHGRVQLALLD